MTDQASWAALPVFVLHLQVAEARHRDALATYVQDQLQYSKLWKLLELGDRLEALLKVCAAAAAAPLDGQRQWVLVLGPGRSCPCCHWCLPYHHAHPLLNVKQHTGRQPARGAVSARLLGGRRARPDAGGSRRRRGQEARGDGGARAQAPGQRLCV